VGAEEEEEGPPEPENNLLDSAFIETWLRAARVATNAGGSASALFFNLKKSKVKKFPFDARRRHWHDTGDRRFAQSATSGVSTPFRRC